MIERMVMLGVFGDLTSRLLMPTVAQVAEVDLLPPGFTIVESSDTDWSTEDFREHITRERESHAPGDTSCRREDAQLPTLRRHPAR